MRTKLAREMKRRRDLIAEYSEASGIPEKPKQVSVGYWVGQQIVQTVGVGKTWKEAAANCDAQSDAFFRGHYPIS